MADLAGSIKRYGKRLAAKLASRRKKKGGPEIVPFKRSSTILSNQQSQRMIGDKPYQYGPLVKEKKKR